MYSLNSNSRRITAFVQQEAYKWLFERIKKNEYDGANPQVQKLIIEIKKEGCVTQSTYDRFANLIITNPFECIVRGIKGNKKNITTKNVENFFVKYNGVALPVGFIKDFFEDDYETQEEINKYIESVVKGQEDRFAISCQEKLLKKSNQISDLKNEKPCVFKPKLMFHITNIIKIVFAFTILALIVSFVTEKNIITNVIGAIRGTEGYAEYLSNYKWHLVFNAAAFVLLIPRLVKAIKTIIFYINYLIIRMRVSNVASSIKALDGGKFDELREYLKSVVPDLAKQHTVTDEMCDGVPAVKKQYFAVEDFNFREVLDKISALYNSKQYAFLSAYYEDEEKAIMKQKKKAWRKTILFSLVIILVLSYFNVPAFTSLVDDLVVDPIFEAFGWAEDGESSSTVSDGDSSLNNSEQGYYEIENVALGAVYKTSIPSETADASVFYSSGVLNDGSAYPETYNNTNEVVMFNSSSTDYYANGYHTVTFDLGESYDVSEIVTTYVSNDTMVSDLTGVAVFTSEDGENFEACSSMSTPGLDFNGDYRIHGQPVYSCQGRYIQLRYFSETNLFLTEIEIRGAVYNAN